jgi:hypothetical protein
VSRLGETRKGRFDGYLAAHLVFDFRVSQVQLQLVPSRRGNPELVPDIPPHIPTFPAPPRGGEYNFGVSQSREVCQGAKKDNTPCSRPVAAGQRFCWQHASGWKTKWRALTRSQLVMFLLAAISLLATLSFGIGPLLIPRPNHSVTFFVHDPEDIWYLLKNGTPVPADWFFAAVPSGVHDYVPSSQDQILRTGKEVKSLGRPALLMASGA